MPDGSSVKGDAESMKFTGRLLSLLIVVLSSLGVILYSFVSHGYLDMIHLIVAACYILFGWWLGKQYDKVKYLSEKDLLTESYNRRFVVELFPKLKHLSQRRAQKLIIFLLDVDDFKSINDQHDHAMGDHVLQLISNTLKHMLRDSDYIVRWGGDEFLIILPNLDEPEMKQLQNRLHCELKPLSNVVSLDVSVSIGYAIYPDEGTELNDLIKIADKKMYSDKRGKNGIYRSMQK